MTAGGLCGADMHRCEDCGGAVAPSLVRRGESCPKHPGAATVPGSCKQPALAGCERCRLHGGRSPQARHAAAAARVEAQVAMIVADAGWAPVTNPFTALADLLGEVTAVKDLLAGRVAELQSLTVLDDLGREDVRALLAAYERALDRCGRLLVDAAKIDIDAGRVRLEAAQAELAFAEVSRALRAVLAPEQVAEVQAVLAGRFREVTAGKAFEASEVAR